MVEICIVAGSSGNQFGSSYQNWKYIIQDFPDGAVDENLPANAGDTGLIPGLGSFHMLQKN